MSPKALLAAGALVLVVGVLARAEEAAAPAPSQEAPQQPAADDANKTETPQAQPPPPAAPGSKPASASNHERRLRESNSDTSAGCYRQSGTQIPAAECLALGLVNRLSKEGETLNDAKALARQLAKRAPLATAAIIRAVDDGLEVPMAKSIDVELEQFLPTLRSEDASEGIQAFFAKREAQFKGR